MKGKPLKKSVSPRALLSTHTKSSPVQPTRPTALSLRADDLPRPGLMFRSWLEMYDLHLHRLHLQVFGRDPAYFVCDFIPLDWDVFPLDAETQKIQDNEAELERFALRSQCNEDKS